MLSSFIIIKAISMIMTNAVDQHTR